MNDSGVAFLIGLPRPQYPPLPEAFTSAIASRIFEVSAPPTETEGKAIGLRYRTREYETGTLAYRGTAPQGKRVEAFGLALEAQGVASETNAQLLGEAVANSIDGVRTEKGDSQAASPMTPALALLQNARGMQGSKNPPDLGEIVEQLFSLGRGKDEASASGVASASELWLSAVEHRMHLDPMLAAVDAAVDQTLLFEPRKRRTGQLGARKTSILAMPEGTPFRWFRQSWMAITSERWVEALPARVWVDWATTVIRLGFGLGYLWESAWYDTLARRVIGPQRDEAVSFEDVCREMPETLPWRSSRSGAQSRDVAPLLVSRSHRAVQLRAAFSEWAERLDLPELTFSDAFAQMQNDHALCDALQNCLRSPIRTQSGKNLWEASRYSLMTRTSGGQFADYYGLLRPHGRYLTPEPGTEWIAVVASLACGGPGRVGSVADVLANLTSLGVRPEMSDLIALLERAGLARGSADADQGVLVQSAF